MNFTYKVTPRYISAIIALLCFIGVSGVSAQSIITVNTLEGFSINNGNCSLNEALAAAESESEIDDCDAGTGADVIRFSVTGTIVATEVLSSISQSVTIEGPGSANLTLDASAITNKVLSFFGATAVVSGITFSGGQGFNIGSGANVNFQDCVIAGMASVSVGSAMEINNSSVSFDYCTVTGSSGGSSGTLYGFGADITITNSTFTNNSAALGGAVTTIGNGTTGAGTLVVENSTFTGNAVTVDGGAFWIAGNMMTATITSSTIVGNTADSDADGSGNGGGVRVTDGASATIANSIIAGNMDLGLFSEPDISAGPITSAGFNIIGDCTGACGDFVATGDQEGTSGSPINPLLAAITDNGGPTTTMAPITGSPAIDAGSCTGSSSDQRNFGNISGTSRIVDVSGVTNVDDGCDIGAYEVDGVVVLPVELVSFGAVVDGASVVLAWQTASEVNNAGFSIEMADPVGASANQWKQIAWIDGNTPSPEIQRYSHRHSGMTPGVFLFRLKQLDFDGSQSFSDQVEVTVDVAGSHLLSHAYPNPFQDQSTFWLTTTKDQDVQIAIFDLIGRKVDTIHSGPLSSGVAHEFAVNGRNLTSGVYLIQVTGESFSENVRVVVRK